MSLEANAVRRLPEGNDSGEWTLAAEADADAPVTETQVNDGAGQIENGHDQTQQQPATPQFTDLDRVALGLGWTPKDQWRGDPAKWTPADVYIANTGKVLERTKTDLKRTRLQTDELNARLARVELGFQNQQTLQAKALNEEYENAKFEAAKAGDDKLYRQLTEEQAKELAKIQPAPQAERPQADVYAQAERIMQDPIAARFFEANPIALQDEQAWALMDREMSRVHAAGKVSAADQFEAAERALRYAYPDAYERPAFNGMVPANNGANGAQHHSQEQPRADNGQWTQQNPQGQQQAQRRPAPPMNPGTRTPPAAAKTAVDMLPADARTFLNAQVKAGKVKNQEAWAKAFLGERVTVSGRPISNGASA